MVSIGQLADIKISQSSDVLFQDLDGELVLLNTKTGEYFGLNDVGTRIWILLKENWSLPEILKSLESQYKVSLDKLLDDVNRFLMDLESCGLVSIEKAK